MAQRIHNLSKWQLVGSAAEFDNPYPRLVKIDVNCPVETEFYVERNAEDLENDPEVVADREALREVASLHDRVFLGLAKGREQFEFWVEGMFTLEVSSPCWLFTVDSIRIGGIIEAPLIFTRIANRRQRNPHLEMIEYQMRRNMDAFASQLVAETERRIVAVEKGLERHAVQRNERAPVNLTGGKKPEQSGQGSGAASEGTGENRADEAESRASGKPEKSGKASGASDNVGKKAKTK